MRTAFVIFLTLVWSASAQSVYLRVETIAEGRKTTGSSNTGYGSYHRSHSSGVELKVTLRNMHTQAHTYTVEWNFYAKNQQSRKTRVHDSGTNSIPLKVGETSTFELKSAELTSETHGYASEYSSSGYTSGEKHDGYLILVKDGDRIIAVEASDATVKRSYQSAINAARLQPKPVTPPATVQPRPAPQQPK